MLLGWLVCGIINLMEQIVQMPVTNDRLQKPVNPKPFKILRLVYLWAAFSITFVISYYSISSLNQAFKPVIQQSTTFPILKFAIATILLPGSILSSFGFPFIMASPPVFISTTIALFSSSVNVINYSRKFNKFYPLIIVLILAAWGTYAMVPGKCDTLPGWEGFCNPLAQIYFGLVFYLPFTLVVILVSSLLLNKYSQYLEEQKGISNVKSESATSEISQVENPTLEH